MSEHIVSRKLYFVIFFALMVLTVLTVVAARQDFGRLNDIIAMAIAVTKATLVVLFFMHVRYSSRLTKVVVVSGFFWLAILVILTLSDFLTRNVGPSFTYPRAIPSTPPTVQENQDRRPHETPQEQN